MNKGDLVLFIAKGFFAKIVNKLTKGKYSHIEIIVFDQTALGAVATGLKLRYIQKDKIGIKYDIWRPDYPTLKDRDNTISHVLWLLEKNPRYGFVNFMAFACIKILRKLKVRWFEDDYFFVCSELIADSLEKGSMKKLTDTPNSLLSPNCIPREYSMKKVNNESKGI